jgi:hypothetical protein
LKSDASQRYQGHEQRAAPRLRAPCRAFFSSGRIEGTGSLRDLSASGACLEETTSRLKKDTPVTLTLELQQDGFTINIAGRVARQTKKGFAIEFYLEPDPSVEQFMSWVLARFSPPSTDGEPPEEEEAEEIEFAEVEEEDPGQ